MDLRDILLADIVLKGRIGDYEIIPVDGYGDGRLRDYAQMTLFTYAVLYQNPESTVRFEDLARIGPITITWQNSTFGEPEELEEKRYIVALQDFGSALPPLRSGSAFLPPFPDPEKLTLLQAPCSGAFIFEADGDAGRAVEMIFDGEGEMNTEIDVLAEFLGMDGGSGLY